ncbi:MAG TPA: YSC84-related protein [Malonomonas sp.]
MVLLLATVAQAAEVKDYSAAIRVFKSSDVVQPFFENSYGYVVFPLVGKAGVVVGGAFGIGQVYRNERVTGKAYLTKLSLGFQLGGQAFSEIIFFEDQRAFDEFTSGTFELDASASAVAITAGAQAQVGSSGTSVGASNGPTTGIQFAGNYVKGMAVFVHTKGGLMYELSVGGQVFSYEALGY